jgi:formylglycine-generating enzyme required for sulfatase activity
MSFEKKDTCIDASLCDVANQTCLPYACPTAGGPVMVQLPEGYCIDSTEVTRSQYESWLQSVPSFDDQITECSWNTDYAPEEYCWAYAYHGDGSEHHPQVCVDWCDAFAFCKAVGKRLCGRIGGGPFPKYFSADDTLSQWGNACASGAAKNLYPYGPVYDGKSCNGVGFLLGATAPVGSIATCQSTIQGYGGVFDLSGNVIEFEDSCEAGSCRARGGAYFEGKEKLVCTPAYDNISLNFTGQGVGFRCCAP